MELKNKPNSNTKATAGKVINAMELYRTCQPSLGSYSSNYINTFRKSNVLGNLSPREPGAIFLVSEITCSGLTCHARFGRMAAIVQSR